MREFLNNHVVIEGNPTNVQVAIAVTLPQFRDIDGVIARYIDGKIPMDDESGVMIFALPETNRKPLGVVARMEFWDLVLDTLRNKMPVKVLCVAELTWARDFVREGQTDKLSMAGMIHTEVFPTIYLEPIKHLFEDYKLVQRRLNYSLSLVSDWLDGTYAIKPVVNNSTMPFVRPDHLGIAEFQDQLNKLLEEPILATDIEGSSLDFMECGIRTISFAPTDDKAQCFDINYRPELYRILKRFFEQYDGELIFHKSQFDLKVIIYALWGANHKDSVDGIMCFRGKRRIHDTMFLAYLANNTATKDKDRKVPLGLKEHAFDFTGVYAEDLSDVNSIPFAQLAIYNNVDVMATKHLYDRYIHECEVEEQLQAYYDVFAPSILTLTLSELVGLPINRVRTEEAEKQLREIIDNANAVLRNSPYVDKTLVISAEQQAEKRNKTLKKIKKTWEDFYGKEEFSANSNVKVGILLHTVMGLPVIETTKKGNPSTSKAAIEALRDHQLVQSDPSKLEVLDALVALSETKNIYANFIKSFLNKSRLHPDGCYYLHGNLNIGGTVSGRMSSSEPNMQNIPSTGSVYSSLIKQCIQAPEGFVFSGADYASLEDYISALTTRDPNKMKIYEQGYDSHSFRAYHYFTELMPDVVLANDDDDVYELETDNGESIYVTGLANPQEFDEFFLEDADNTSSHSFKDFRSLFEHYEAA